MTITNHDFLNLALKQQGKPYVFGAQASINNPNPRAFDCSELVRWCLGRLGIYIPDGAINQYPFCQKRGLAIRPSQAIRTPGALMFKEGVGRHARIYHVGITIGDGKRMMEAKGSSYGCGVFNIGTWANSPAERLNCWNLAALAPGLAYVEKGAPGGSPGLWLALFAGLGYRARKRKGKTN